MTQQLSVTRRLWRDHLPGPAATACLGIGWLLWLVLLVMAECQGLVTLAGLAIFGALALLVGALASLGAVSERTIVLADAAAGGAMLSAALVFVVPHALIKHAVPGTLGLATGIAIGALLHRATRGAIDQVALTGLTLHTISAGVAIGALYTFLPALGWTAGLAILAHKAPAGYLLARRLREADRSRALVGWPAMATGLGALSIAMMHPTLPISSGLMFGIAAGLFSFVALGFIRNSAGFGQKDKGFWAAAVAGAAVIALAGWALSSGA
ncbi:hypothetical protein [Salinisphaera japonica]|uniref:hypothetical protein n=1 Tax=Salinisphaera japonica TaxID=1304270 RepID=UPI000F4D084D|nr:hypothetical protein [Salinisphaera japonica]